MNKSFKTGFVAFVGRPNVGKSSLINAIVGEKVSIVSPKPQTTRDKALGIFTDDKRQIAFVDTPGIHKPRTGFAEGMVKAARSAAREADIRVTLIDSTRSFDEVDKKILKQSMRPNAPLFVVITKADLGGFERIYPLIKEIAEFLDGQSASCSYEIIPTSVRSKLNLDKLLDMLTAALPEGEPMYPADEYTDKSTDFMIGEIIREKALFLLRDEIPHGINVSVVSHKAGDTGAALIDADITVERKSHKAIIIGGGGSKLKEIGERARGGIEKLLGGKVYLTLFIKVREGWRDK